MKRGAGFVCLHYAVEFPADKGGPQALDWMGGFFEENWSVNPHWQADLQGTAEASVTNGVKPFSTNDEWYFHMRFNERAGKLTHILSAIAPDSTMSRKDGPHEGNPRSAPRSPRRNRRRRRGRSSGPMAAAASASPADISTRLGQRRAAQIGSQRDPLDGARRGPANGVESKITQRISRRTSIRKGRRRSRNRPRREMRSPSSFVARA
jgi:hypothetical protein